MPVGIAATDCFIQSLTRLSGKRVQKVILDERGRLVDAMADSFHHTMMKRVAIFGDPDTVLELTRFVCELGMTPVAVAAGTKSKTFTQDAEAIFAEYQHLFLDTPKIFNGGISSSLKSI